MPDINENQDTTLTRLTEYPEYQESYNSFVKTVISELKHKSDPFLQLIQKTEIEPVEKVRTVIGDRHFDIPLMEIEYEFHLTKISISNADIDDLLLQLYNCSVSGMKSLMPQLFKRLSDILNEAGQTMDAQGQPFSNDLFLDMLERIQIRFDESGNPIMPTILAHPSMAKTILNAEETEEQKKRFEEIINRKRDEFNASRRNRKLSRSTE